MVRNALVECLGGVKLLCWLFTSDLAVQRGSSYTRQKIFVLCLWMLTFLVWGQDVLRGGLIQLQLLCSCRSKLKEQRGGGCSSQSKKLWRSLNTLTCRKQLLKELFKIWMNRRCKWLAKRPAFRDEITIGDCVACTGYASNWLKFLALFQIL